MKGSEGEIARTKFSEVERCQIAFQETCFKAIQNRWRQLEIVWTVRHGELVIRWKIKQQAPYAKSFVLILGGGGFFSEIKTKKNFLSNKVEKRKTWQWNQFCGQAGRLIASSNSIETHENETRSRLFHGNSPAPVWTPVPPRTNEPLSFFTIFVPFPGLCLVFNRPIDQLWAFPGVDKLLKNQFTGLFLLSFVTLLRRS